MTPYLIAGAALISGAAGFYGGWTIKQGRWDAATLAAQEKKDDEETGSAKAIATRDVKHMTITQKVIRETVEKPVYRDCVHDADSMRDINAALSVSADPGELPASDAAK